MKKPMTAEEIALARKWLGVECSCRLSDVTLNDVVNGTMTYRRIQLKLAFDSFKKELLHALFGGFTK